MSVQEFDNEEGARVCPYCSCSNDCDHLLLLVDKTFRDAEGGALMRLFNDRWSDLCQMGGDDFDEREHFEDLLEEIDSCADYSADFDYEGGPGRSSAYSIYYVKSAEKSKDILARLTARFMSGGDA